MICNCNSNNNTVADDTVLEFIKGTTFTALINFIDDVSDYNTAAFTIRKNYNSDPIINKTFSIANNAVNIELSKDETNLFNDFENGKNSISCIWGLNIIDALGNVINVFPKTGENAPLCIVFKNVVVKTEE